MGYRSDIRLIMKKSSLETFENGNNDIREIIEDADINKEYGILIYLGWDDVKSDVIDTITEALDELVEKDLSYRFTTIGEDLEDIEEQYHTSKKDEKLFIPYPSIIRAFDETYLEEQMKYFNNMLEKSQESKEDIDI